MAARDLAQQGIEAYERRDYAAALEVLRRAHDIVPAPSILIQIARAERELGRLVEAGETYRRLLRTELDPKAPQAYRLAVHDAEIELAALLPRIPRLRIAIDPAGFTGSLLHVTQDGLDVPTALQGVAAPINPGRHEIRAVTSNGSSAVATVELKEGQVREAVLRFSLDSLEKSEPPQREAGQDKALVAPRVTPEGQSSAARGWAYVGLGLGATGLAVGVVTGVMANGQLDAAEKACPTDRCEAGSAGAENLASFRSLRTVSTVGYVSGAVFAGAGVSLLVLAPGPSRKRVALRLHPTGVTVAGGFW